MVHGARRESLGGWNEISYRGIFGSISNLTKTTLVKLHVEKARSSCRSCGIPVPPSDPGTPGTRRVAPESHFRRHTSGRRSNVMPRLYHCPARLLLTLHVDLTGEVTAGGRQVCSTFVHRGATSHMVES